MDIYYISDVIFSDCDLPLVKSLVEKGNNVKYIIIARNEQRGGGLFNFKDLPKQGIFNGSKIEQILFYKEYINVNQVEVLTRSNCFLDAKNWIVSIKLFIKILRSKVQIIHITQPLGVFDWLLYIFRRRMVITVHDPLLHSGEESISQEIKRHMAFNFIPLVFLLNNKQTDLFIKKYSINQNKINFNRLGVYDTLCYIRDNINIKSFDYKYFLFFGHISPYKGVDILCEAIKLLNSKYPNVKCVIAGKGNFDFDINKYKSYNIVLLNKFINIDELVELITNCLFVVCPYKDATQSGVVSSSFALGKAVVASNVGALSDMIIDGITGKLVEPKDPLLLANAIDVLLSNDNLLKQMTDNINVFYRNGEMSWNKIATRYINGYKQICH